MTKTQSEATHPGRFFLTAVWVLIVLGTDVTSRGGRGGKAFTVILILFSDYLGRICPLRRSCLPLNTNGFGHIYPRFFGTFPRLKNTMVKEPFMNKIFDASKWADPNGGIDIFFEFFTPKLF